VTAENVTELNLTPHSARPIIKVIAEISGRVFFKPHAIRRMKERDITRPQILRCLKSGRVTEGPSRNMAGNWEVRMEGFSSGEEIAVVIELEHDTEGNRILVITTYLN